MLLEYVPAEKAAYVRCAVTIRSAIRGVAMMLALAVGVQAQSHRAAIRGQVVDASGAVVAGAAIMAVNEATNETRSVASSESGAFALAELAPGTWRVE